MHDRVKMGEGVMRIDLSCYLWRVGAFGTGALCVYFCFVCAVCRCDMVGPVGYPLRMKFF